MACIEEKRNGYGVLVGKLEGEYFEDLGVARGIILKQSLKK